MDEIDRAIDGLFGAPAPPDRARTGDDIDRAIESVFPRADALPGPRALGGSADEIARDRRDARDTGVPLPISPDDRRALREEADQRRMDALLEEFPATRRALANPVVRGVASQPQDVEELARVERRIMAAVERGMAEREAEETRMAARERLFRRRRARDELETERALIQRELLSGSPALEGQGFQPKADLEARRQQALDRIEAIRGEVDALRGPLIEDQLAADYQVGAVEGGLRGVADSLGLSVDALLLPPYLEAQARLEQVRETGEVPADGTFAEIYQRFREESGLEPAVPGETGALPVEPELRDAIVSRLDAELGISNQINDRRVRLREHQQRLAELDVDPELAMVQQIAQTIGEQALPTLLSILTRSATPAVVDMFGREFAGGVLRVEQLNEERAAEGRPLIPPDQMMAASALYAFAGALPERLEMGALLRLMREPSFEKTAAGAVLGAISGGATEALTEAIQMGIDTAAFDEATPMDEAVDRMIDAGIIGFFAEGVLAAGGGVIAQTLAAPRQFAERRAARERELARAQDSAADAAARELEEIAAAKEDAATVAGRDPEAVQAHTEETLRGTGREEMHVDIADIDEATGPGEGALFQSEEEADRYFEQRLGVESGAMQRARERGGSVRFRTARWQAEVAGTDAATWFKDHFSFSLDGDSVAGRQRLRERRGQAAQRRAREQSVTTEDQVALALEEFDSTARPVFDRLVAQLSAPDPARGADGRVYNPDEAVQMAVQMVTAAGVAAERMNRAWIAQGAPQRMTVEQALPLVGIELTGTDGPAQRRAAAEQPRRMTAGEWAQQQDRQRRAAERAQERERQDADQGVRGEGSPGQVTIDALPEDPSAPAGPAIEALPVARGRRGQALDLDAARRDGSLDEALASMSDRGAMAYATRLREVLDDPDDTPIGDPRQFIRDIAGRVDQRNALLPGAAEHEQTRADYSAGLAELAKEIAANTEAGGPIASELTVMTESGPAELAVEPVSERVFDELTTELDPDDPGNFSLTAPYLVPLSSIGTLPTDNTRTAEISAMTRRTVTAVLVLQDARGRLTVLHRDAEGDAFQHRLSLQRFSYLARAGQAAGLTPDQIMVPVQRVIDGPSRDRLNEPNAVRDATIRALTGTGIPASEVRSRAALAQTLHDQQTAAFGTITDADETVAPTVAPPEETSEERARREARDRLAAEIAARSQALADRRQRIDELRLERQQQGLPPLTDAELEAELSRQDGPQEGDLPQFVEIDTTNPGAAALVELAEQMMETGIDPVSGDVLTTSDIVRITGIRFGPDGKAERYVGASRVKRPALQKLMEDYLSTGEPASVSGPIGQLIDAPDVLMDPRLSHLAAVPITIAYDPTTPRGRRYREGAAGLENAIVSGGSPEMIEATLNHEMQHLVDTALGRYRGTAPETVHQVGYVANALQLSRLTVLMTSEAGHAAADAIQARFGLADRPNPLVMAQVFATGRYAYLARETRGLVLSHFGGATSLEDIDDFLFSAPEAETIRAAMDADPAMQPSTLQLARRDAETRLRSENRHTLPEAVSLRAYQMQTGEARATAAGIASLLSGREVAATATEDLAAPDTSMVNRLSDARDFETHANYPAMTARTGAEVFLRALDAFRVAASGRDADAMFDQVDYLNQLFVLDQVPFGNIRVAATAEGAGQRLHLARMALQMAAQERAAGVRSLEAIAQEAVEVIETAEDALRSIAEASAAELERRQPALALRGPVLPQRSVEFLDGALQTRTGQRVSLSRRATGDHKRFMRREAIRQALERQTGEDVWGREGADDTGSFGPVLVTHPELGPIRVSHKTIWKAGDPKNMGRHLAAWSDLGPVINGAVERHVEEAHGVQIARGREGADRLPAHKLTAHRRRGVVAAHHLQSVITVNGQETVVTITLHEQLREDGAVSEVEVGNRDAHPLWEAYIAGDDVPTDLYVYAMRTAAAPTRDRVLGAAGSPRGVESAPESRRPSQPQDGAPEAGEQDGRRGADRPGDPQPGAAGQPAEETGASDAGAGGSRAAGRGRAPSLPGLDAPPTRQRPDPSGTVEIGPNADWRGEGEDRGGRFSDEYAAAHHQPLTPSLRGSRGPIPRVVRAARLYAERVGLYHDRQTEFVEVDEAFAKRIAQAYQDMKHAPQDRRVKEAYADMIRQTVAQFEVILETGLRISRIDPNGERPYQIPREALDDIAENNHLWFDATDDGFGSDETFDPSDNPLLAPTRFTLDGKPLLANDIFRIVHDYFGHGLEGATFRARGEENAWQAHILLYYGRAVDAVTTETRGQNSWVNFGPNSADNQTASGADTTYADQKVGILPWWVMRDRRAPTRRQTEIDNASIPTDADGMVILDHWSPRRDLTSSDPSYYGNGFAGDEAIRKQLYADDWVDRTYFGAAVGDAFGYLREGRFDSATRYRARIPADRLYDFDKDPDGLRPPQNPDRNARATAYERAIKDAGYAGYYARHPYGFTAAVFEPIALERYQETPFGLPQGFEDPRPQEFEVEPAPATPAPQDDDLAQQVDPLPGFVMGARVAVERDGAKARPPNGWRNVLLRAGVTQDELDWLGWDARFGARKEQAKRQAKVTREEVLALIDEGSPRLEERELSDEGGGLTDADEQVILDRAQEILDNNLNEAAANETFEVGSNEDEEIRSFMDLDGGPGQEMRELAIEKFGSDPRTTDDYYARFGFLESELATDDRRWRVVQNNLTDEVVVALPNGKARHYSELMYARFDFREWSRRTYEPSSVERHEAEAQAREELEDELGAEDQTKWSSYAVPGGENYRELLIRDPSLIGRYNSPHFKDQEVVHLRMDDRRVADVGDVLFIHEIQSDLHQRGRRLGYREALEAEIKQIRDQETALEAEEARLKEKAYSSVEQLGADIGAAIGDERAGQNLSSRLSFNNASQQLVSSDEGFTAQEKEKILSLPSVQQRLKDADRLRDIQEKLRKLTNSQTLLKGLPPRAPLAGDRWMELAIKVALRKAEEEGYDAVAFANAEQIADAVGGDADDLGVQYDEKIPGFLKRYVKPLGGKLENVLVGSRITRLSAETLDLRRLSLALGDSQFNEVLDELGRRGYDEAAFAPNSVIIEVVRKIKPDAIKGRDVGNPFVRITPEMRKTLHNTKQRLFQDERLRRGWYEPQAQMIKLTNARNLTTMAHEGGHVILEMYRRLASRPDAPAAIREDFARMLEVANMDEADLYQHPGDSAQEAEARKARYHAGHEQFARAHEVYLMTGKAPTAALQPFFARITTWLTMLYQVAKRSITQNAGDGPQEVEGLTMVAGGRGDRIFGRAPRLDEQAQRVFDRIYATEAQLQRAVERSGFHSLQGGAADYGMSEAEWRELQRAEERAMTSAHERAIQAAVAINQDEQQRLYDEVMDEETARQQERLEAELPYRVARAFRRGDLPPLSRRQLIEDLGLTEEEVAALPREMLSSKTAPRLYPSLQEAARALGLDDARDLVRTLLSMDIDAASQEVIDAKARMQALRQEKERARTEANTASDPGEIAAAKADQRRAEDELRAAREDERSARDRVKAAKAKRKAAAAALRAADGQKLDARQIRSMVDTMVERDDPVAVSLMARLPSGSFAIPSTEVSDAEAVARMFGYRSADGGAEAMLSAIASAPPVEEAARAEAEARMAHLHPDRASVDEGKITDLVHGEAASYAVEMHIRALAQGAGVPGLTRSTAKVIARDRFMLETMRDALKLGTWLGQERRAARKAAELQARISKAKDTNRQQTRVPGLIEALLRWKEAQLLNIALVGEARTLDKERRAFGKKVDRLRKQFKRLRSGKPSEVRKNSIAPDYLEVIEEMLWRVSMTPISKAKRQEASAFLAWRQSMIDAGREAELVDIPERIEAVRSQLSVDELSVDEFRGLVEAIDNLIHLGSRKADLQKQKRLKEIEDDVAELAEGIAQRAQSTRRDPESIGELTPGEERGGFWSRLGMSLMEAATIVQVQIDAGDPFGRGYEILMAPIVERLRNLPARMRANAERWNEINAIFTPQQWRRMKRLESVPGHRAKMSHADRLAVGLNWGNEGNRDALRHSPTFRDNPALLEAILDSLSEQDIRWINAVHAHLESFRSEIAAKERRLTGVEPTWVEGTPAHLANGSIKGGYYPLSYSDGLQRGEMAPELGADGMLLGDDNARRRGKAQTRRNHMKERVGSGGRNVSLNLANAERHTATVIYDLELGEAVADASARIGDRRFRGAMTEAGREAGLVELDTWLRDIATGEVARADAWSRAFRQLRGNWTYARLAFSFTSALIQPTGLVQSWTKIGLLKADMLSGLIEPFVNPRSVVKAYEESAILRDRAQTINKEMSDAARANRAMFSALFGQTYGPAVVDVGYAMMAFMQRTVDVPTYLAARRQGMRKFGDEAKAIRYAEKLLQEAQVGQTIAQRSAFERGSVGGLEQSEFIKTFSTLMSYMALKPRIIYTKTAEVSAAEGLGAKAVATADLFGSAFVLFWFEAFLTMLLYEMLKEGDWEEERANEATLETLFGIEDSMIGEAHAAGVYTLLGSMPGTNIVASRQQGFVGGSAVTLAAEDVARAWTQVEQGEVDLPAFKSIVNAASLAVPLPASQINRTMEAALQASEGEDVEFWEYATGIRD